MPSRLFSFIIINYSNHLDGWTVPDIVAPHALSLSSCPGARFAISAVNQSVFSPLIFWTHDHLGHLYIVFIMSYLQHLIGQRFDKSVLYFLNYRSSHGTRRIRPGVKRLNDSHCVIQFVHPHRLSWFKHGLWTPQTRIRGCRISLIHRSQFPWRTWRTVVCCIVR